MTVIAGVFVAALLAQTSGQPAPAPPPVSSRAPEQPQPAKPPASQESYSYNPDGRRDPFVSLLVRGRETTGAGGTRRSPQVLGLGGLTINEVALRGIVRSKGSFLAILQAPDNKSYIVKVGDRLADGLVKAISPDAVIFSQEVNDPLSLVKVRDIRKPLRTIEEGA